MADWMSPDRHTTTLILAANWAQFPRKLDMDAYGATLAWSSGGLGQTDPHRFVLICNDADALEFAIHFQQRPTNLDLPSFGATRAAAADHWQKFWSSGAAIDLTSSTAKEAPELQRRIILSQYVTALNCAAVSPLPKPDCFSIPGTASSIWKCTGGTPFISPRGIAPNYSSEAWIITGEFWALPTRMRIVRDTTAAGGRRWSARTGRNHPLQSARC